MIYNNVLNAYLKFVGLVIQCFCMTGPFGFLPLPNGSSDFHLNTVKVKQLITVHDRSWVY